MFVVVSRYLIGQRYQKKFAEESSRYYEEIIKTVKGFHGALFLRNTKDIEHVDVLTVWDSADDFARYLSLRAINLRFSFPHKVFASNLYESLGTDGEFSKEHFPNAEKHLGS